MVEQGRPPMGLFNEQLPFLRFEREPLDVLEFCRTNNIGSATSERRGHFAVQITEQRDFARLSGFVRNYYWTSRDLNGIYRSLAEGGDRRPQGQPIYR